MKLKTLFHSNQLQMKATKCQQNQQICVQPVIN